MHRARGRYAAFARLERNLVGSGHGDARASPLGEPTLQVGFPRATSSATSALGGQRRTLGGNVAETYNGYCVKCKEKRDFEGEVRVSESGRRMAQGTCPVCGTKMNRILGKA